VFREYADRADICIAKEYSILSNDDNSEYDKLLERMLEEPKARVLVCFCEGETVHAILKAIRRFNRTGHFLLVGRLVTTLIFPEDKILSTLSKYIERYRREREKKWVSLLLLAPFLIVGGRIRCSTLVAVDVLEAMTSYKYLWSRETLAIYITLPVCHLF